MSRPAFPCDAQTSKHTTTKFNSESKRSLFAPAAILRTLACLGLVLIFLVVGA